MAHPKIATATSIGLLLLASSSAARATNEDAHDHAGHTGHVHPSAYPPIGVMGGQIPRRLGMTPGDGERPAARRLNGLRDIGRGRQLAQRPIDGDLPDRRRADEQGSALPDQVPVPRRQPHVIGQRPQQDMGVQQNLHEAS